MTADIAPIMINEELRVPCRGYGVLGRSFMTFELLLAAFMMAVGLAIAGAGTHFYQWMAGQQAVLRYDGKTYLHSLGNLALSFVCGPYIMLQMGWKQEDDGTLSVASVLVSALVAFGWSFVVGLLVVGVYVAVLRH